MICSIAGCWLARRTWPRRGSSTPPSPSRGSQPTVNPDIRMRYELLPTMSWPLHIGPPLFFGTSTRSHVTFSLCAYCNKGCDAAFIAGRVRLAEKYHRGHYNRNQRLQEGGV